MKLRVHLQSAPAMWASYEGHVDVTIPVPDQVEPGLEDEANECAACGRIWRGSTPDSCCPYCHSGEVHMEFGAEPFPPHLALTLAVRELARTSFPDRPSVNSWRLVAIEELA